MKTFTYVIEHMEEDDSPKNPVPPWVKLEYAHMRTLTGPNSQVCFTYLSKPSRKSLEAAFSTEPSPPPPPPPQSLPSDSFANHNPLGLAEFSCHQESVVDLMKSLASGTTLTPIDKICLLDPKAERELCPEDGESFDWFLFGGILGDDPPRDRTSSLRVHGFPSRHLGPIQMTTDTAIGVTKRVVADKITLSNIPYIDFPTIKFNANESVEMPFRYISVNGEPLLPPGMKELLKEDLNKGFEF